MPSRALNARTLAQQTIAELRRVTNRERQAATLSYYPSAEENLGVYVTDLRAIARRLREGMKSAPPEQVLEFVSALLAQATLEGRQVAYEVVMGHRATMAQLTLAELERLGHGMDNWASVDGFACGLAGPAWRTSRIRDADVRRWTRSKDVWWRRAALVATTALNMKSRGGDGDVPRTLDICARLAGDEHVMVHKALSWALRSAIPHDSAAVQAFVDEHATHLPKLVLREVRHKLSTGRKSGRKSD
jgi:3-methyladenine DNA glycosylase AlkD